MASISSAISLFVLLLVTYCYSVPIVTNDDYTTSGYDFATGKPLAAHESKGFTLPEEYTTVFSTIHHKRGDAENKDDQASVDQQREEAGNKDDQASVDQQREEAGNKDDNGSVQQERSSYDETTPEPFEATSVVSKRSAKHESDESESHEKTTQRSLAEGAHQKRHSFDEITSTPFEATSIISERSVDTEVSDELTTERSYVERDLESDSFSTFESSTQFNNRVGQFGQRESVDMDVTTVFEPTSSDESFSQATGLLHQREGEQPIEGNLETKQPQIYYQKTETIVPGKITKTELTQGENQSYAFKELSVEQQVSSFSEGTTEENDSKTNNHH